MAQSLGFSAFYGIYCRKVLYNHFRVWELISQAMGNFKEIVWIGHRKIQKEPYVNYLNYNFYLSSFSPQIFEIRYTRFCRG